MGGGARTPFVPYSLRRGAPATLGLNALLARVFGSTAGVTVLPTVSLGEEDALDPALFPHAPAALVAALFSLTATPEPENHGAFIEALAARLERSTPFAVLVDESAFRLRFNEPGSAGGARLDERRAAWQRMLAATGRVAVFVDLAGQDFADAERALRAAIDAAPAHPAKS